MIYTKSAKFINNLYYLLESYVEICYIKNIKNDTILIQASRIIYYYYK